MNLVETVHENYGMGSPASSAESVLVKSARLEHPVLNILIIGDKGIGKTTLAQTFVSDPFEPRTLTPGVQILQHYIHDDDQTLKVQIWVAESFETLNNIDRYYFSKLNSVILVYDGTEINSFVHLQEWFHRLKDYVMPRIPRYILGTKYDSKNLSVCFSDVQGFAAIEGVPLFLTSAHKNVGVETAFNDIIKKIKRDEGLEACPSDTDPQQERGCLPRIRNICARCINWLRSFGIVRYCFSKSSNPSDNNDAVADDLNSENV